MPVQVQDVQHLAAQADRRADDRRKSSRSCARTRDVNWVDLTGGEIFLRPDIDDIFEAIVTGWRRLAILHFPTNGFLTDRIVRSVERIAGRGPAHTVVTVSLDGDEALNDEIRGIKGGFRRQIETFKALRRIPGIVTALGMTLSTYNVGQFDRDVRGVRARVPGPHGRRRPSERGAGVGALLRQRRAWTRIAPDPAVARAELQEYRRCAASRRVRRSSCSRTRICSNLDEFLQTGRTPMPCHALRASCFIDPWGVVYPCITYSRPLGRLRDTGMRLEPIWNAARDRGGCRARSGTGTARSAGPRARRIRAFSATCWRSRRTGPVAPSRSAARPMRRPRGSCR